MMSWNDHRWVGGGVVFLLIFVFPLPGFCQKASIQEASVKGVDGGWKVGFFVENCFTEKMEEAIQTGIQTIFTFYLQLYQERKWWRNRKVATVQFRHAIQFDPIGGEYRVTLGERGETLVTRNFSEAKQWMARVESVEIRPSSRLKPGVATQLEIMAELDPVRLPLHLEYLFFFVSLWDFKTDWHVVPLAP